MGSARVFYVNKYYKRGGYFYLFSGDGLATEEKDSYYFLIN